MHFSGRKWRISFRNPEGKAHDLQSHFVEHMHTPNVLASKPQLADEAEEGAHQCPPSDAM